MILDKAQDTLTEFKAWPDDVESQVMAMLTLNGVLQNVYSQPERKDEKTGEIRPASLHAQILAENVTQTGKPNWRWSRSRCTRMRSSW